MKTVFFIRHAKSSWEDMSLKDIDRPLNKRGNRDAPFMAKMIKGKGIKVDAIISSPANRAYTTASFFAKELEIPIEDIIIEDSIYEAYIDEVLNVIKKVDDRYQTIMIFGHNPTFTSLANMFSKDYIANVPTCGIAQIESSVDSWTLFNRQNATRTGYFYPKQYF